ncbi:hypothetical protein BDN67DRAFT_985044 [Paxillus ammoniavirescens]|nr:hypothetical protein BDN67DRAFT_985044 [Paxillus ammoniavirescens]
MTQQHLSQHSLLFLCPFLAHLCTSLPIPCPSMHILAHLLKEASLYVWVKEEDSDEGGIQQSNATSVELHGLLKELTHNNLKCDHFINNNILWSPPRPHAFHKVDKMATTTRFKTFNALPRFVKAVGKENKA